MRSRHRTMTRISPRNDSYAALVPLLVAPDYDVTWGIFEHAGPGVASVMVDKMELDDPIDTISLSLSQPSSSSPLQPIFCDPDSNALRNTKETRLSFRLFCFGVCGPGFFLEPTRVVLFACFSRLSCFFCSASSCSS